MTPATIRWLTGRLLVATPVIDDPNFDRSVVFVLEHSERGALGLVLNRPTDIGVVEPLPQWASLVADPGVVFSGGPVDADQVVAIGELVDGATATGFEPVLGQIGTVLLSLDPAELGATLRWIRVFVGYAGWGPGQLEAERRVGAWFDVDTDVVDVRSTAPDGLWASTLLRQGPPLAWFARFPVDPICN